MPHLTAKARTGRVNNATQNSDDLNRVLGELRTLWEEASKAEPARRSKLQAKIVQAIEKLKKQVGDQLTDGHSGRNAYPLFGGRAPDDSKVVSGSSPALHGPRFPPNQSSVSTTRTSPTRPSSPSPGRPVLGRGGVSRTPRPDASVQRRIDPPPGRHVLDRAVLSVWYHS